MSVFLQGKPEIYEHFENRSLFEKNIILFLPDFVIYRIKKLKKPDAISGGSEPDPGRLMIDFSVCSCYTYSIDDRTVAADVKIVRLYPV